MFGMFGICMFDNICQMYEAKYVISCLLGIYLLTSLVPLTLAVTLLPLSCLFPFLDLLAGAGELLFCWNCFSCKVKVNINNNEIDIQKCKG